MAVPPVFPVGDALPVVTPSSFPSLSSSSHLTMGLWRSEGKTTQWSTLPPCKIVVLIPEAPLWIDRHSSAKGMNDRVPLPDANSLASSLRLIRVDQLELSVSQPGRDFGNYRRSVQGRFHYAGTEYWLRVTDPIYERRYLQRRDGDYQMGARFVTVSLGEAYQGYSYKLIAAIIEP